MASQPIYQFYAELEDYEPKIWRRFQVPRNITVARLGYIVMTLFEMQAKHFFCIQEQFKEKFKRHMLAWSTPEEITAFFAENDYEDIRTFKIMDEEDDSLNENTFDATEEKIYHTVSVPGDYLTLLYDYGDSWGVKITLESIFEDKELPGKALPRVLEGEGYGIIENCGGTEGLQELKNVFKKKKGQRYKVFSEWLQVTELDLDTFDIEEMNYRLKKIPRIYTDIYEYDIGPTKQSLDLIYRKKKIK